MKILNRFFLMLTLLAVPALMTAATVSEQEARQKAADFLRERGFAAEAQPIPARIRRAPSKVGDAVPFFVFNVGAGKGFVIVSGDDRTPDILGYSDSGTLTDEDMPEALRWWLDGYARQMEWLDSRAVTVEARPARAPLPTRTPVSPLLTSLWDQGAPYNNLCPAYWDDASKTCAVGCVATSVAQVMYYHRHPAQSAAIPGYTTRNNRFTFDALPATTFEWADMTPTYSSSSTAEEQSAVATLMQYCGHAVRMNYGLSSGAYTGSVADVLRIYFGYSNKIDFVHRRSYSYAEWNSLIYSELVARRPVCMGGQSSGGGHAFVCDGYDSDDYFHFNWGWSGNGNGYYRLSALDPYEQGIGGSSTLDGFSYEQDAVIGIQPAEAGETVKGYCLALLALQPQGGNVVSRNQDGQFHIGLSYSLHSLIYDNPGLDLALQFVNAGGTVLETADVATDITLAFDKIVPLTKEDLQLGGSLADGTYTVRMVSRVHGEPDWLECYGGSLFTMQAVVNGNTLTLTPSRSVATAKPTLVSIETETIPTVGNEVSVLVKVTGSDADYYGDLLLYADSKKVMGKQADIPAGKTVEVKFAYIPATEGGHTLDVRADGTKLGQETITVTSGSATMDLTLDNPTVTFNNLNTQGHLFGVALRATITLSNPSADLDYVGQVNCSFRKYTEAQKLADSNDYEAEVQRYDVLVPRGGTLDVPVSEDGLEPGYYYRLRITYYYLNSEGKKAIAPNDCLTDFYLMDGGYLVCATDGTTTPFEKTSDISFGDAQYVDLTSVGDLTGVTVTASTNPNCLYLMADGATVPAALNGCNVVRGNQAAQITMQDDYGFRSPISFTADAVSYTRTFDIAAAGNKGWTSIMLPFTVATVKVDDGSSEGKTVDWFHGASDSGKNFWLKTFTGDDTGHVYFDYADELKANTPYIIAVPGDTWGPEWQMTGKAVTFSAANVTIEPATTGAISGNNFKFFGSTVSEALSSGYALNGDGSKFQQITSSTTIHPFRAWMTASPVSSLAMPALTIASGIPNSIDAPVALPAAERIYDLQGRAVGVTAAPGIYIKNGKKHVVK